MFKGIQRWRLQGQIKRLERDKAHLEERRPTGQTFMNIAAGHFHRVAVDGVETQLSQKRAQLRSLQPTQRRPRQMPGRRPDTRKTQQGRTRSRRW